MTQKYETLPKDIEWHFIGHLQTNKVKYMAPYVAMIHAIDSVSYTHLHMELFTIDTILPIASGALFITQAVYYLGLYLSLIHIWICI